MPCFARTAAAQILVLYKAKLLSYIGSRTAAIDHATDTVSARLDRVRRQFLQCVGLSAVEALTKFKLAPQTTRRDIAMLGLVHRTVFGHGPPHFAKLFERRKETCTATRHGIAGDGTACSGWTRDRLRSPKRCGARRMVWLASTISYLRTWSHRRQSTLSSRSYNTLSRH